MSTSRGRRDRRVSALSIFANVQLTLHPFDLPKLDRLDVMQRKVPWSSAKQLRTVLETEYSANDVFESLIETYDVSTVDDYATSESQSEAVQKMIGHRIPLLRVSDLNTQAFMEYREFPFPWYVTLHRLTTGALSSQLTGMLPLRPLTNRDMLYVQDYVRVTENDDGNASDRCFYTYNHSIEHPYFASRAGFVRTKIKYHGMVGVVGDRGKTRLTWLCNIHFGGLVPTSFTTGVLVTLMAYPSRVVEDTKEYVKKQAGELTVISKHDHESAIVSRDHRSAVVSREAYEEVQKELGVLRDELKSVQGKLATSLEEKAEFKRAIEEKDRELKRAVAEKNEKDEQIMELRRRLPRIS